MEIPESLNCLFTAQLAHRNGSYVLEIPEQEVQHGALEENESYRVAIIPTSSQGDGEVDAAEPTGPPGSHQSPIEPGDTRVVEIESLGDQGDGIARVDHGFVVIVPDTEPSERVRIEIADVRESVAFANVVERLAYYE
jgi:predicted RNA-binding protein with TRAM domain